MERKNIVSKFFDIPLPGVAILAIISSLSLLIIFSNGFDEVPLSRVFYTISAYTLSVICFKAGRVLRKAIKKIEIDGDRRRIYMLYASIIATGAYIILKSVVGILFSVPWLVTLAFYYFLLLSMKIALLLKIRKGRGSVYTIAALLAFIAASLAFLTVRLIRGDYHFHYPGFLIYAFALYSFVSLAVSIAGFIKDWKSKDSGIRCFRAVSLSSAAVSLVVLQSAMFSSFGYRGDEFERIMYASLSFAVVVLILIIALSLVLKAREFDHFSSSC